MGRDCGSVGRVVVSDTSGAQHSFDFIQNMYFRLTVEKTKIKKKRTDLAHILDKLYSSNYKPNSLTKEVLIREN